LISPIAPFIDEAGLCWPSLICIAGQNIGAID
jgi:hypothetical protein